MARKKEWNPTPEYAEKTTKIKVKVKDTGADGKESTRELEGTYQKASGSTVAHLLAAPEIQNQESKLVEFGFAAINAARYRDAVQEIKAPDKKVNDMIQTLMSLNKSLTLDQATTMVYGLVGREVNKPADTPADVIPA